MKKSRESNEGKTGVTEQTCFVGMILLAAIVVAFFVVLSKPKLDKLENKIMGSVIATESSIQISDNQ